MTTAGVILNEVLPEIGIDRQGASVAATDFEMRQIRAQMNLAALDISRRTEWPKMSIRETASDIGGAVKSVTLPANFHEMSEKGSMICNHPDYPIVRPIVAPELWEFIVNRPSKQPYYYLTEGSIYFSAFPKTGTIDATYRYTSLYFLPSDKPAITENADDLLVPGNLVVLGTIWRYLRQKGLPFDDYLAEYEAKVLSEMEAERGL